MMADSSDVEAMLIALKNCAPQTSMKGNRALRVALDKMCGNLCVQEHRQYLAELATEHAHSIAVVADAPGNSDPAACINCVAFALNVTDMIVPNSQMEQFRATGCFPVPVRSLRFLHSQLSIAALPEIGSMVIYFGRNIVGQPEPTHIGRWLAPNRVRSKWGAGLTLDHGIWEVPQSFGNDYAIYEAMPTADVERFVQDCLAHSDL